MVDQWVAVSADETVDRWVVEMVGPSAVEKADESVVTSVDVMADLWALPTAGWMADKMVDSMGWTLAAK